MLLPSPDRAAGAMVLTAVADAPDNVHAQDEAHGVSQHSAAFSPALPESNSTQQPTPKSIRSEARGRAGDSGELVAITADMHVIPIRALALLPPPASTVAAEDETPAVEADVQPGGGGNGVENEQDASCVGPSQIGAADVLLTMQRPGTQPSPPSAASPVPLTQASAAGMHGAAALAAMQYQRDRQGGTTDVSASSHGPSQLASQLQLTVAMLHLNANAG